MRERWRNSFCRVAWVCDRVGGYGLGTMVVISGLYAGTGLCGLRGGSGGIGGRLRRMEVRSCFVGLAEVSWLREMMGTAGGVSIIGAGVVGLLGRGISEYTCPPDWVPRGSLVP